MTESERIAVEAACGRLIRLYANLNDAARWDELAALYTEDALFARPSAPDDPVRGRAAILGSLRARPRRVTRHVCANIVVDVEDADTARAFSVILLFSGNPPLEGGRAVPGPGTPLVGTFTDRLVRTPDGWRFAERHGALDFHPH